MLREAYRAHQFYLQDLFLEKKIGFHGLFLAKNPDLSFTEIEDEMISLLTQTRIRLLRLNTADRSANSTLNSDLK